jgi:pimeloyl-ACP methyl ester carboxylesterase
MVAYDLRGHGMSDKPVGDAHYRTGKFWGDEVRAVIEQAGLRRPTLVGRSCGGRVMGDYLMEQGHAGLAATDWAGAVSPTADPSRFGRGGRFGAQLRVCLESHAERATRRSRMMTEAA